jgi:hypothetical protein
MLGVDHPDVLAIHDRNDGICGAEVDSNNFAHVKAPNDEPAAPCGKSRVQKGEEVCSHREGQRRSYVMVAMLLEHSGWWR